MSRAPDAATADGIRATVHGTLGMRSPTRVAEVRAPGDLDVMFDDARESEAAAREVRQWLDSLRHSGRL